MLYPIAIGKKKIIFIIFFFPLYTFAYPQYTNLPPKKINKNIYIGPKIDILEYLAQKMEKTALTKKLSGLIFQKNPPKNKIPFLLKDTDSFWQHQDKNINTYIFQINPFFVQKKNNFLSILPRIGNLIFTSKKSTIKKYFQQKTVTTKELIISLDKIYQLPYIKKATVNIKTVDKKNVDLYVNTVDKLPIKISKIDISQSKWGMEMNYNNVLGLGHQWKNYFLHEKQTGNNYILSYDIPNIFNTAVDIRYKYNNTQKRKKKKLKLLRQYPYCHYIGGIKINFDNNIFTQALEKNIWIGKNFFPQPFKKNILSFSTKISYYSPYLWYQNPKSYLFLLNSIGFWKKQKKDLIKYFGKKELQTLGHQVKFLCGYKIYDKQNSIYFGGNIMQSVYIKNIGYVLYKIYLGSFLQKNTMKNSFIHILHKYFSSHIKIQHQKLRFLSLFEYKLGLKNTNNLLFLISKDKFYKKYGFIDVKGTKYFNVGIEAILFMYYNFVGFKIEPFGRIKNIFINHKNKQYLIIKENYYPSFEFGLRIYNNKLKFRTFEFSFALYPTIHKYHIQISSVKPIKGKKFLISEPKIQKK